MEPQTPDQNQPVTSATEPWHAPLNKVTLVSKILAAVVFITLPFVGFWLGMSYPKDPIALVESVQVPANVETTTKTETTESVETEVAIVPEGTATTTVTAYVVKIDTDEVVLDYIDILFGEEAVEAAVIDGVCSSKETCFSGEGVAGIQRYKRNINPTLRTFKLSPEVKVYTWTNTEIPRNDLANYVSGYAHTVTVNNKNEVTLMVQIFEP